MRFRYPAADADALAGLDLDVRPGERIALVGSDNIALRPGRRERRRGEEAARAVGATP